MGNEELGLVIRISAASMSLGSGGGRDIVEVEAMNLGIPGGRGNVCRTSLFESSRSVKSSPSDPSR